MTRTRNTHGGELLHYYDNAELIGPVRVAMFSKGAPHLVVSTRAWALCGAIDKDGGLIVAGERTTSRICPACAKARFGRSTWRAAS